jgi:hypothetical protein
LLKQIFLSFIAIALIVLGVDIYKKNIINRTFDMACGPASYGIAKHFNPERGPYFGLLRGDDDSGMIIDSLGFAKPENAVGLRDADVFSTVVRNDTIDAESEPYFAPEIIGEQQTYTIDIAINGASVGDPVRGWIDFNGNGNFEEDEKASTEYNTGNKVSLTWRLPLNLNPSLTFLRIRTCESTFVENLESPSEAVKTGEVEDYPVRITKTIVPQADLKDYIDFLPYNGKSVASEILPIISDLTIGKNKISIKLSGTMPDIVGINNLHEPSITGLRIGHEDTTKVDINNPMIVTLKPSVSLENINFQIIDIDAGDNIKVEGFNKGVPVSPFISNCIDNFFYQYNSVTKLIYGNPANDAGNGKLMPSSLSMSVNVCFKGFVDSIKLSYADSEPGSSGTFTIGNFNARKHNIPDVEIEQFSAKENAATELLSWKMSKSYHLLSYSIERSYDNVIFETIGTKSIANGKDSLYAFTDHTISPIINYCFYRLKKVAFDNHVSYSPIYRVKRNEFISTSGFVTDKFEFTTQIKAILLKDMKGEIKVTLYDYNGTIFGNWRFENKKETDTINLGNLASIPVNIYYVQVTNNTNRYTVEVNKEVNVEATHGK